MPKAKRGILHSLASQVAGDDLGTCDIKMVVGTSKGGNNDNEQESNVDLTPL